ncbi:MAG: nuclear transport factor 2 family protein [Ilumatobacteraceae bacterium]
MAGRLDELLELERAGWTSLCDGTGSGFYGALMTDEARMVLANGAIMNRDAVVAALDDAPPWASYEIDDPALVPVSSDVVALVYTGTGHRREGEDFTGIMTSTYLREGSEWRLALYQQTPKS